MAAARHTHAHVRVPVTTVRTLCQLSYAGFDFPESAFTVSAWYRISTSTIADNYIVAYYSNNDMYHFVARERSGTHYRMTIHGIYNSYTPAGGTRTGAWIHVTFSRTGTASQSASLA